MRYHMNSGDLHYPRKDLSVVCIHFRRHHTSHLIGILQWLGINSLSVASVIHPLLVQALSLHSVTKLIADTE